MRGLNGDGMNSINRLHKCEMAIAERRRYVRGTSVLYWLKTERNC